MKTKKALQLASLLTIGSISVATIVPLCLVTPQPKIQVATTTPGLVDWITDWDTTGSQMSDFDIKSPSGTVTASAILNTMALYLNTVSTYSVQIDIDSFVNDIIITNITSSDQTNYTFTVSTKVNPILYVLDSPIAGVHCIAGSHAARVNLQDVINSSNASAAIFNSGFANATLPSAKMSRANAMTELVTRSQLSPSLPYSMPGLNVNQITLPNTPTVGVWTSAADSYSVLVSPIAQSNYYTAQTSSFNYNIARPSLSTSGLNFTISDVFQDVPTQNNVITRFRNANDTPTFTEFWSKVDSGQITLTYGNLDTVANTMQITAMSGDENYTIASPITINFSVRVPIDLSTKVGTGKEVTPIAGMVLILPDTFQHEDYFYQAPVESDIMQWLQYCTWDEYDPTNHQGADRYLPFNNNYSGDFIYGAIDVTIVPHSGDATGTMFDVTLSPKPGFNFYTGVSHTCVITLAE